MGIGGVPPQSVQPRGIAGENIEPTARQALSITIDQVRFHYALIANGRKCYVYSYLFTAASNVEPPVRLSYRRWRLRDANVTLTIPNWSNDFEKLSLWGETPTVGPGEPFECRAGIAFDSPNASFEAGWIGDENKVEYPISENISPFSIDDSGPITEIDISNLGESGKLSSIGAASIIRYISDINNIKRSEYNKNSPIFVDFSEINGLSSKDKALICSYLICISRENHSKERSFDLSPLLPFGMGLVVYSVDHFMKVVFSKELGGQITVILKVTGASIEPAAQLYLDTGLPPEEINQLADAVSSAVRAIRIGIDVPALIENAIRQYDENPSMPVKPTEPVPSAPDFQAPATLVTNRRTRKTRASDRIFTETALDEASAIVSAAKAKQKKQGSLSEEELQAFRKANAYYRAWERAGRPKPHNDTNTPIVSLLPQLTQNP